MANVITTMLTTPLARAARVCGGGAGGAGSGRRPPAAGCAGRMDRRVGSTAEGVDAGARRARAVAESGVGSLDVVSMRSLDRAKRTSCAPHPVARTPVPTLSAVHRNIARRMPGSAAIPDLATGLLVAWRLAGYDRRGLMSRSHAWRATNQ